MKNIFEFALFSTMPFTNLRHLFDGYNTVYFYYIVAQPHYFQKENFIFYL